MTAIVVFFAVIGIANVVFMLIFVAMIAANERAARRGQRRGRGDSDVARAWDDSDVPVIGRGGWR